jgi:hypothetical protein
MVGFTPFKIHVETAKPPSILAATTAGSPPKPFGEKKKTLAPHENKLSK